MPCLWTPLRSFVLAISAATAAASALASDAQMRALAAPCATCHGTQGHSLGGIPSIAGMERQQLLQKLMAYQQGTATATVMHQHAKAYTPLELEALATFFSQQSH